MVKRYKVVLAAALVAATVTLVSRVSADVVNQTAQLASQIAQNPRFVLANLALFAAALPAYYYVCNTIWERQDVQKTEAIKNFITDSLGYIAIVGLCLLGMKTGANSACLHFIVNILQRFANATRCNNSQSI